MYRTRTVVFTEFCTSPLYIRVNLSNLKLKNSTFMYKIKNNPLLNHVWELNNPFKERILNVFYIKLSAWYKSPDVDEFWINVPSFIARMIKKQRAYLCHKSKNVGCTVFATRLLFKITIHQGRTLPLSVVGTKPPARPHNNHHYLPICHS